MGAVNAAAIAVALALLPFTASVRAGSGLPDPMRPSGAGAAGASGRVAASHDDLRLQSVLLGRRGEQSAVISGTLVTLGGRVGDARLVRLTERSAVLQGPQGALTLLLVSGMDLPPAASSAPVPALPSSSTPIKEPTP